MLSVSWLLLLYVSAALRELVTSGCLASLRASPHRNNKAGIGGGGVYLTNGVLTAQSHIVCDGNTAEDSGGCIWGVGSSRVELLGGSMLTMT